MAEVRCNGNYVFTVHGKPMGVAEGESFDENSEVVRRFRWAFDAPVERATAAPGERRTVRVPKQK